MPHHHLIIGGGVAGIAAAEAIRQQDPAARITLIGNEPHKFYSRPGLAYYLTGELPEKQLFLPQATAFENITAQVAAINPQQHKVHLQSGSSLPYDRLLIATGSRAAKVALPGAELQGVVKLDTLDDVHHILKLAKKARQAVVVGGGITALELVEGLRARGVRVTYLLRSDRYWRNVLDEAESHVVEARLRHEGVELRHRTQLAQIIGDRGRVMAVETGDGQQIKCQLVAVAVGVRPNVELAKAAALRIERGILVDEFMQTSAADVFAAGDVAQVFDPQTGSAVLDTLWPVARAQGQAAGRNMAGANTPYRRTVPLNVTRLAGLTTAIIGTVGQGVDDDVSGIVRGDSETWRQLPDSIVAQNQFDVNRLRLVIGDTTLLGAIVMGDQTLTRPIYRLIAAQADISPIKTQLLQANGHLADVIADFWTTWSTHHGTPQP
jgi:NADPH-dependent 2,4-dienoyl-CoA reductase/sulfur reductase-like enzyme